MKPPIDTFHPAHCFMHNHSLIIRTTLEEAIRELAKDALTYRRHEMLGWAMRARLRRMNRALVAIMAYERAAWLT